MWSRKPFKEFYRRFKTALESFYRRVIDMGFTIYVAPLLLRRQYDRF